MALVAPAAARTVATPLAQAVQRPAGPRRASRPETPGAASTAGRLLPGLALAAPLGLRGLSRPSRGCRSAQAASRLARCATGKIETFLVRGPVNESTLALASAPLAAHIDLSCLVFFCLGTKPETVASVAGGALGLHGMCPVYIADCYGIIGWDKKEKRNVELMEEGRGSEYGKPGGQGGEGVVVAAFRGGGHAAGDAGGVHMVVSSHGKAKLQAAKDGEGVSYGGYAKACYKLEHSGDLVPVDEFVVSSSVPSAVTSFDGDNAAEMAKATAAAVGSPATAAGYFPCFCRGYNKYEENDVEPKAFEGDGGLAGVPLFGMFAHGELGPGMDATVAASAEEVPKPSHEIHSMTSVLAVYS